MKFTLSKQERLKSKKIIKKLYEQGDTIKVFPLKMKYLQTDSQQGFPAQFGVSVPKRNFKKAVDRNKIKRRIRESYRLEKHTVYNSVKKPHIYMISYIGKQHWEYRDIRQKMKELLFLFVDEIANKKNRKI